MKCVSLQTVDGERRRGKTRKGKRERRKETKGRRATRKGKKMRKEKRKDERKRREEEGKEGRREKGRKGGINKGSGTVYAFIAESFDQSIATLVPSVGEK